jgi:alpha-glucosidase (family GH31 glycosyl hydrolase)
MQFGAFSPIMRAHGHEPDTEPWKFGKETEEISREYIRLRYRLLPYSYFYAWENHRRGLPVARSLLLEFPADTTVSTLGQQYLWGEWILVAPVTAAGQERQRIYLPAGGWTDFWTGERHFGPRWIESEAPLERLPLFVRDGAILPMQSTGSLTSAMPLDTLLLDAFPSENADCRFLLYEDDGASYDYETGEYSLTTLRFTRSGSKGRFFIAAGEGSYAGVLEKRTVIIQLRSQAAPPDSVRLGGVAVPHWADREGLQSAPTGWWFDAGGGAVVVKADLPTAEDSEILFEGLRMASPAVRLE